jgi:phosphate transport system protein
MPQAKDHIVKSFDEEIRKLNNLITYMGGLAESQLQAAVEALLKRDADAASRIIHDDAKIDEQETLISQQVVRLLALRQPMAIDLRQIVAALKISSDLERFGDYATNVAKRSIALSQLPPLKPLFAIPRMAKLVQQNMKDVLDAYTEADADKAMNVWKRDEEVDEMYTSLFRELLTYMMEDQRNISPSIHLLFIAKNIERMGDDATNIAETIHFIVHGHDIEAERPKGDNTSFSVFKANDAGGVVGSDERRG